MSRAVVIRHLDAKAVVRGCREAESPLLIEWNDEIGVGYPGCGGDIVCTGIGGDDTGFGRQAGVAFNIDVRTDIDDSARERHLIEAGHGCCIAGEYTGVIRDGCLTGKGASQACSGLFSQLEPGGMSLTRDHQQGDGGRFDDGMHGKILAVTRRFNRSYEWRQDFIWYDQ